VTEEKRAGDCLTRWVKMDVLKPDPMTLSDHNFDHNAGDFRRTLGDERGLWVHSEAFRTSIFPHVEAKCGLRRRSVDGGLIGPRWPDSDS
jgi:hypothetical protein